MAPWTSGRSRFPFKEENGGFKSPRGHYYREVEQLVACQAHNLKVGGSSPPLATKRSLGLLGVAACLSRRRFRRVRIP